MKIFEGGTFVRISGEIVGPMVRVFNTPLFGTEGGREVWNEDGVNPFNTMDCIIEEARPPRVCCGCNVPEDDEYDDDEDCPVISMTMLKAGTYGAVTLTHQGVSVRQISSFEEILTAANILIQIGEAIECGAAIVVTQ